MTPQEIFENLMLPLKSKLSDEDWNFLISRGNIFIKQTIEVETPLITTCLHQFRITDNYWKKCIHCGFIKPNF